MKLLVGTSKGLVVYYKQGNKWQVQKTHFLGLPVSVVYVNDITNTWWVGISHYHWGQKLHFSDDNGASWKSVALPKYPYKAQLSNAQPATLKKIWVIQHGGTQYPNRIWLGTEPGGLFKSEDNGQSFQLIESLWNHPSRMNRQAWFGTGRNQPFIHSIVVDPADNDHIYIAVSCAGIFETKDGGITWYPRNKGLIAAYLPNPHAEIGHDPHRLHVCTKHPNVLWQQNHCGIFKSINRGKDWIEVSDKDGIANYGFALAIDHCDPDRAWVIPALSDEMRIAPRQALTVCRTSDGGKSWEPLKDGLPQSNCFDIVFRHALTINNNFLAFGTTTGNLYLSSNYGDSWICLSNNLARVDYVSFAE